MTSFLRRFLLGSLLLVTFGCSPAPSSSSGAQPASPATSGAPKSGTESQAPAAAKAEGDDAVPPTASPYDALPKEARSMLDQPFKGDLDEMIKRRLIRAGVVFNRTQYFIDKGVQRGISYESLKLFEDELNKRLKTGLLKVHVAMIPLSRDQLGPALLDGKVDLVAATITITPERKARADFSNPTRTGVSEIVVTGPGVPSVATADDLSGREVFVREGSSYLDSLQKLNASLKSRNKPPAVVKLAPVTLEDDDILEMVNAGLVESTVVNDFIAEFWQQVFPNLTLNKSATLRTGGEIGIAVRKNNPKLLNAVNTWIKEYGPRTAFGNMMEKRYLQSTTYVKSANSEAERAKFLQLAQFFKKYGDQYNVDYVLMAAQGYQESRLDQSVKSQVGAIGVMQVMPTTGKDLNVGDIKQIEPNIHAGVKYFRFMVDQYYKDDPMDPLNKGLMTLASYNAGPAKIRRLRAEAAQRGLNPNVWFGNVERVVSERIGRETVTYVSNIYKYYLAYKLALEHREARERAKTLLKQKGILKKQGVIK